MITDSPFLPAISRRSRRSRWPRRHSRRLVFPLVLLAFATFVAGAQAHSETASTACSSATGNSVTFYWSDFANPAGTGNGGRNTPDLEDCLHPDGRRDDNDDRKCVFPIEFRLANGRHPGARRPRRRLICLDIQPDD